MAQKPAGAIPITNYGRNICPSEKIHFEKWQFSTVQFEK